MRKLAAICFATFAVLTFTASAHATSLEWVRSTLYAGNHVTLASDEGLSAADIMGLAQGFKALKAAGKIRDELTLNLTVKCFGFHHLDCRKFAQASIHVVLNDQRYSHFDNLAIIDHADPDQVTIVSNGFDGYELEFTYASKGTRMQLSKFGNIGFDVIRNVVKASPERARILVFTQGWPNEESAAIRALGARTLPAR